MTLKIRKKDGTLATFNQFKVENAVYRSTISCGKPNKGVAKVVANEVVILSLMGSEKLTTTMLQENVEEVLGRHAEWGPYLEAYVEYRAIRDASREGSLDLTDRLNQLNSRDAKLVNENANKDSRTFYTMRDLTAGTVAKTEGLRMLPKHVANAHLKGEIHVHDLDYQPHQAYTNCCLIDFEGMLRDGFKIGNAEVESPRSIQTAMAQVSQIIANVASSQYGGCSFNRADEVLAEYAEMNYNKHYTELMRFLHPNPDERIVSVERVVEEATRKTKKDIYDAMQAHEYEINTLFSANGRLAVY